MPNKLSQFWQELKRRKVIRVVTVYAGAAFVIIELINNITEPLHLPDWTPTLVIVLLAIGLPVVFIFSWIYDLHPEEGVVKTRPASKAESKDIPGSSKGWKIASYISFVVIVGLIVLNIIPRATKTGKREILDKSIAILPFINDSPDQERMYFINGTMEAILDHLSKIEDLRVVSRTSVEQYRNNPKPIPVVAEEMDVSYILEGSGHRDEDNVRLILQLLDGRKDQHLWSKTYDAKIGDIFSLQSEIAQQVAGEIEAIITPEEKALIEKKPTESQTAYDLFIKANQLEQDDPLKEELCRLSLEYDSTFVWPYYQLGWTYYHKYENSSMPQSSYIDSVRKFLNKALVYDDQDAGAYNLRGYYYRMIGENKLALDDYNRALELNPNFGSALQGKVWLALDNEDQLAAIKSLHQVVSIDRGNSLPNNYRFLGMVYFHAGFKQPSNHYSLKAMELDGDSAQYYYEQARNEFWISHDFNKALGLLEDGYMIDKTNTDILQLLGLYYEYKEQYDKSLSYYEKYISQFGDLGKTPYYWINHLARAYRMNGNSEVADTIINQRISYLKQMSAIQETDYSYSWFLAQAYALKGEKEKAYEHLKTFNRRERMAIYQSKENIKLEGFFIDIFNEAEFQLILRDLDAKYQTEHERVRQWLEENDML